jgi:hypothetical protein
MYPTAGRAGRAAGGRAGTASGTFAAMTSRDFWWRATVRVAARPRLWPTAVHQAFVLARPGWWKAAPFLPLPDPEYLRFRMETQDGAHPDPDPADVVQYLEWCRTVRSGAEA